MIPPNSHERSRLAFASHLSQSGKSSATCFRSILLTRNRYPPQSVLHANEKNAFYEYNKLSRESIVNKIGSKEDKSFKNSQDECRIRLTILQPRKTSGKNVQLGKIENEDEILSKTVHKIDAIAASHGFNNLKLDIKKYRQDATNIASAARLIQQSDMILGGNDPSMTNIMFARPHTAVIEVQNFGYSTGPYRSFASTLNLTYMSVMARPDALTFERCVLDKYDKNWGGGVSKDEMEARMNGLLRMFRDAAEKFDGKTSMIDLTSFVKRDGSDRRGYIPLERVCARLQHLNVDTEMVGALIAEQAAEICELRMKANAGVRM